MNLGGLKYWLEISIAWFGEMAWLPWLPPSGEMAPIIAIIGQIPPMSQGGWASYTENSDDEEIGDKNDIDNDFKLFPQP